MDELPSSGRISKDRLVQLRKGKGVAAVLCRRTQSRTRPRESRSDSTGRNERQWREAQRNVEALAREMALFCQGHSVGQRNDDGDAIGPQVPTHYSASLAQLLSLRTSKNGKLKPRYKTIRDFALALYTIFRDHLTKPPVELPEAVMTNLHNLYEEMVDGEVSGRLQSTYVVHDESYKRRGVSWICEVPVVYDESTLQAWDQKPFMF